MKIGIIGSGNMGRTLGLLWMEKGYDVFFGGRNQTSKDYLVSKNPNAKTGSIEEAVNYGDLLLYSLRETLPSEVAKKELWDGKIIIDINNWTVPADFKFPPVLQSFSEKYHQDIPNAKIIKAFNHLAQEVYYHPLEDLKKQQISGFYAGDDSDAKKLVSKLIEDTGLVPVDCGGLENARLLESYADLVRLLIAARGMGPYLAFETKILPPSKQAPFGERQPSNFK